MRKIPVSDVCFTKHFSGLQSFNLRLQIHLYPYSVLFGSDPDYVAQALPTTNGLAKILVQEQRLRISQNGVKCGM